MLVRDADALRRAFAYHFCLYHHFDQQATNFVDFGTDTCGGFRALKVWLGAPAGGEARGHRRMISGDIQVLQAMASAVARRAEFEPWTQWLSITTFR